MRSDDASRFHTGVPDFIARVRAIMALAVTHPAIPLPWPESVPSPEHMEEDIARLEKAYLEMSDLPGHVAEVTRARRQLKISLARVVKHIEVAWSGGDDTSKWPGFDVTRNPGGIRSPEAAASSREWCRRKREENGNGR